MGGDSSTRSSSNAAPHPASPRVRGEELWRSTHLAISLLWIATPAFASVAANSAPRKWLDRWIPEIAGKLDVPEYATPLEKARLECFAGQYKRALLSVAVLPDSKSIDADLIRGEAMAAVGRDGEAMALLRDAKLQSDLRAQILLARILRKDGLAQEAVDILAKVIKEQPKSILARFELAKSLETIGDLKSALKQYSWFIDGDDAPFPRWQRDQEKAFDNAEEVVCIGRAADRWAAMTSAYKDHAEFNDAIFSVFVRAYDVVDRSYWPAHVAAAEYYLSHDNDEMATAELKAASAGNPRDSRVLFLAGVIQLASFNFDGCDAAIAALRETNSASFEAELLEARNLMGQRRPQDAQVIAERAVHRQPKNLEALGLLAATYALQLKDAEMNDVLKRVDEIDVDHDDATAHFEVAEQLGAMRQYPRAADQYKIAIERAGWWTDPRNELGLLYTQSGDEPDALLTLNEAHEIDPYNLRTTNYLRLLDDLMKFAKKETTHFIVMYDAKADPVIPEYFSEYLESIHAEVSKEYHAQPPQKTMIEVFPTHAAFSVRTTGSPWIGTVGASTGRVIALVSPRKGESTLGPFNWSQVLRHEYTHTVTLAATDNRIAHWFTEGLAVYQEHSPLRWEWVPMLFNAVNKNELFTLDNLTWGFVRPRRPIDRQLAYAQSFWICSYIEQKYGHDAILKMLDGFKNGRSQADVFVDSLGVNEADFSTAFFAWTKDQVATWGYDESTTKRYDDLRKRGESLIAAKKFRDAATLWEQIATLRPVDALPHQRLAGLYLTKEVNDKEKAIAELTRLHQVELKDNRYAKRIAGLELSIGKTDDAKSMAMQAVYIDPYDQSAHELLAKICEKAGDAERLAREQRVIEILEARAKAPTDVPTEPGN